MRRGRAVVAVAATLVLVSGCITGRSTLGPMALGDWPTLLGRSQQAALERRYADAEQMLAEFAQRYPDTREATETLYWRALYRLDPGNRDASIPTALASLDSYLRSEIGIAHRLEAETLQRLGRTVESLGRVVGTMAGATASSTSSATPASSSATSERNATELRAKDAEIQRLKDELAKANDELERIKRRLTAPAKP
jgi:TolA-binding protein